MKVSVQEFLMYYVHYESISARVVMYYMHYESISARVFNVLCAL